MGDARLRGHARPCSPICIFAAINRAEYNSPNIKEHPYSICVQTISDLEKETVLG
jgi:hypothetical protein